MPITKRFQRMPIRVALVEDQHLFRESLALTLRTQAAAEIVGCYSDARAALADSGLLATADVALIDVRLAEDTAFDLVAELQANMPQVRLIWVSSIEEDFLLHQAFNARLPGFVHKDDPLHELIEAVKEVAQGRTYFSRSILRRKERLDSNTMSFHRILSDREQEVLRLIGAGLSNDEAAAYLVVSSGTIQAHRRNIMARLELHSASELQAYAVRHGFVPVEALKLPVPKR